MLMMHRSVGDLKKGGRSFISEHKFSLAIIFRIIQVFFFISMIRTALKRTLFQLFFYICYLRFIDGEFRIRKNKQNEVIDPLMVHEQFILDENRNPIEKLKKLTPMVLQGHFTDCIIYIWEKITKFI